MSDIKFSASTKKHLGHYVYALVDPTDRTIFYVGKASANNRAFDHLQSDKDEGRKNERIKKIRASNLEPRVEILRYGLNSTKDSFEVEAAIIDAIGLENLTNAVRGHGVDRGRQSASDVERLHGSKPYPIEEVTEPCIMFFINQTYSPTKTEPELYDCTRQFWFQVSEKTRACDKGNGTLRYQTALAVADSVVVRVYSIVKWFAAGTTFSTRPYNGPPNRWEFVGQLKAKHALLGRRLTEGGSDLRASQIGYHYLN